MLCLEFAIRAPVNSKMLIVCKPAIARRPGREREEEGRGLDLYSKMKRKKGARPRSLRWILLSNSRYCI